MLKNFSISLFLSISLASFSQGKFAGSMQSLIGVSYADSRNIPGLEGWQFYSGSVITPLDNPEMIVADVFQKGKSWICFFSVNEDTTSSVFQILDVLEVKNVFKGWQLKTTDCRQSKIENVEIVALIRSSTSQEFLKPAKQAWRFNRDKRRFEFLNVKGIDCLNEGLN